MMLTPRVYARSPPRSSTLEHNEKNKRQNARISGKSSTGQQPTSMSATRRRLSSTSLRETALNFEKQDVRPHRERRIAQSKDPFTRPDPTPVQPTQSEAQRQAVQSEPNMQRATARDLLSATAIPIRRRNKGRVSQRMAQGDHVADFSRLLLSDVKSGSLGSLSRSMSQSSFDGLFGNMNELLGDGRILVNPETRDTASLPMRSVSDSSIQSLSAPDDYTISDTASQTSSIALSPPEKRFRQLATSQTCTDDHPLKTPTVERTSFDFSDTFTPSTQLERPATRKKARTSLRSSLTASLKALKQVAPTSILAKSFFDIQPSLTDDRRPPTDITESAQVRRYFNPTSSLEHAAQLHTWQDHRHIKLDPPSQAKKPAKSKTSSAPQPIPVSQITKNLPSVVPLSTCIPSPSNTPHATSPPIWLDSANEPITRHLPLLYDPNSPTGRLPPTVNAINRHREPRENRDFLRIYVCEMRMRREGKLDEDLSKGRARLWLPALKSDVGGQGRKSAEERLSLISA